MANEVPVIDFDLPEAKKKEPFKFEYMMPSLDWFDIIKVEIKPDDYCYFKLERRYGPTWWPSARAIPPSANSTTAPLPVVATSINTYIRTKRC